MPRIEFPPKQTGLFYFRSSSAAVVAERKTKLENYLRQLASFPEARPLLQEFFEFAKHLQLGKSDALEPGKLPHLPPPAEAALSDVPKAEAYHTSYSSTSNVPVTQNLAREAQVPSYHSSSLVFDPPATFDGWYTQYYYQMDQQKKTRLLDWFRGVDRDGSGFIDAKELATMQLPGQGSWRGKCLGAAAADSLISLFDRDNSRTIDFYEFVSMYEFIDQMQHAFYIGDADGGGTLDSAEIHHALMHGGFAINSQVSYIFYRKYDALRPDQRGLDFLSFMLMVAELAIIRTKFSLFDADQDGLIDLNDFLCLYFSLAQSAKPIAKKKQKSKPKAKHKKQGPSECELSIM